MRGPTTTSEHGTRTRLASRALALLAAGVLVVGVADAAPAQPRPTSSPGVVAASVATQATAGDCTVAADHYRDPYVTMIAAFRSGVWYVRGSLTSGAADLCFRFGNPGDQPVMGDWDGDGWYTPGVFRPSTGTWYLSNSIFAQSGADVVVHFGSPGDVAVPQTPNPESGPTVLAVYRGSTHTYYVRHALTDGPADQTLPFGLKGDVPGVSDYQAVVYRPSTNTWYGRAWDNGQVTTTPFGARGDRPVPGPWDSGGTTMGSWQGGPAFGVYRPSDNAIHLQTNHLDGSVTVIRFGLPTDVLVGIAPACRTYDWRVPGSTCNPAPPGSVG